jgi:hypothetical protein
MRLMFPEIITRPPKVSQGVLVLGVPDFFINTRARFIVGEEWVQLPGDIMKQCPDSGVVVTGQPGIGQNS